tara:strand:+ start:483 stop:623 length:141 start_codon:yes stop_codon:yes gene_type:complete
MVSLFNFIHRSIRHHNTETLGFYKTKIYVTNIAAVHILDENTGEGK